MHCYRMHPADEEPERILTEEAQWTEPWGASEDGTRCAKCGGSGRKCQECWSCVLTGAEQTCPVCAGKVRYEDACPVCRGTGETDGKPRHGVSVFPTLEGLYHYMLVKDADLAECTIVEVGADPSDDVDFAPDKGAMLVIPIEILRCERVDRQLIERIERQSV